jgi:hypothetical protein
VRAKTAYLDGELCGVDDKGLPNFAATQAATDGERGARLVQTVRKVGVSGFLGASALARIAHDSHCRIRA